MNKLRLFNDNWYFTKQDLSSNFETINSQAIEWAQVELPHDWLIYDTKNLYADGIGWYKKQFELEERELKDKVFRLQFDGVYRNSTVYVNAEKVGTWKNGYSSFEFDISKYLHAGLNTIVVKVKHEAPNSRWYSGAGIYRNVYLKISEKHYLNTYGVYTHSHKLDQDKWLLEIETEVHSPDFSNLVLEHKVLAKDTLIKNASVELNAKNIKDIAKDTYLVKTDLIIKKPKLWDINNPYIYSLETKLSLNNEVQDSIQQNIGFRSLKFDANRGFALNARPLKLRGVCLHHDLGALGSAVNKEALKRQLLIMQDMGVNAIRTSHNMPSRELMDLADELGFLIVSEAFDVWKLSKTEYDYANYFADWHEKDIRSWVRRDRNHPSLIMWSIGNEIYDTHASKRGTEVAIHLKDLVEKHGPKTNALVTFASNFLAWENTQYTAQYIPVVGYNYDEKLYDLHHEKYPDWIIYGSETASTVQSRGIYHFPYDEQISFNDDEQCSSLGNCTTTWGARSIEEVIIDHESRDYVLGQFIWTGIDYIGEPTPYKTKNSYFGQVDTAGFRKDTFYMYQSAWTDYKEKPMVHILPYWDFNEKQIIDVRVFSNAKAVELFFNDKSLGRKALDHSDPEKFSADWQLAYKKGVLKALAYDEDGKVIAKDIKSSFEDPIRIKLEANKTILKANGKDLAFISISTEDENGNFVANAKNRMQVKVSGPARLIGLDNGDSTDFEQYKTNSRRLFSGRLLAIIAPTYETGEIKVEVESKNLEKAELKLEARPCEVRAGQAQAQKQIKEVQDEDILTEIPLRKIELTYDGPRKLDQDKSSVSVKAKLKPENTTYKDLNWEIINEQGISSNLAKIEEISEDEIKLKAQGDGEFRLRCSSKNGGSKIDIMSELEFTAEGLGSANLDPYEFIPAANFSKANAEISNGLERGILIPENESRIVAYENVDFSKAGSDELILSIFYNEADKLAVELWDGNPETSEAKKIDTLYYQADPVWGLYQENKFKLSQILKGIHSLYFVLPGEINFGGFRFIKQNLAYQKHYLSAADYIHGDSYELKENALENIGNNVVIRFNDFNFTEGLSKILIWGRSNIEMNTMQIKFIDAEGAERLEIIDFPYSEEYVKQEFNLKNIKGKQDIAFVFLPGSNFDFKAFRFIGE